MTILSLVLLAGCGDPSGDAVAPKEDKAEKAEKAKGKAKAEPAAAAPVAVPAGAKVTFVEPVAGAKVKNPVTVKFAVEGMTIRPAGEIVPDTGHHHLIIDGGPIAAGTVVPMDATHLHFGKGQTETTVELAPGPHKLTMPFADGAHVSFGEAMSATVDVIVE
jgi:hypothetical protein